MGLNEAGPTSSNLPGRIGSQGRTNSDVFGLCGQGRARTGSGLRRSAEVGPVAAEVPGKDLRSRAVFRAHLVRSSWPGS